ncbi:hypothetical protein EV176_005041 [Coemansia sp. RSA 451]|nr:hypothetical protein EV176_005041 [Coemansia sp. RSA 451]
MQVLFDAHDTYVYCDCKLILYELAVNGLYPVMAALLSDPRLAAAPTIQKRDANLVTAAGDDLGDDAHQFYKLTPSADPNCAKLYNKSHDEHVCNNDKAYECEADNMYVGCDDGYKPACDDGYEPVHNNGYESACNDGYGPARDNGYEPVHMAGNTEALSDHATDAYDHTCGDGWNGSASGDSYSDNRGDVAACYDNTFITAAKRLATPYHTPGTLQEQLSDYLERMSTRDH